MSFIVLGVFGRWIGSKAPQSPVLHGTLVGVVGVLLYVGLSRGQPEPVAYLVAHALKVLGGAAGGFIARKGMGSSSLSDPRPT